MHCQIQRQLTIALENYPGRLAAVSSAIANQNINIEAISLIDCIEQGLIRIVVSEPVTCKKLLVSQGFYVIEAEIVAVEITDGLGQLARLTQAMTDAKINIEYTYGSSVRSGEKMHLILKVSDLDKAYQVITAIKES
ncbi:MAG: amino acid-binding protein [Rhizonema sp. PD37]|nr:amino acid-binding protein [Rhizonema sp. PD37]